MPTDAEFTELRENCTWEWTSMNSINGRKVTGPNGNSIFLPAAGFSYGSTPCYGGYDGDYWSSSLYFGGPSHAWYVHFDSDYLYGGAPERFLGQSIRPVCD